MRLILQGHIRQYEEYLLLEEKSAATRTKYLHDMQSFADFAAGREVTKQLAREWKRWLLEQGYAARTVNAMLASLNSFLCFLGWTDCRVKTLRIQRQAYCPETRELTKEEYLRLLKAAEDKPKLYLLLQTICATGIRVSELQYFTVETVSEGEISISCKGKNRKILIPGKLRKRLLAYAGKTGIRSGPIFVNRKGTPLNRSSIWRQMKALCASAGVAAGKVFPHNLRKLFARSFYALDKDIAKLADILGHSSIDTTRIYIMTTGSEHRRKIERLGLVV